MISIIFIVRFVFVTFDFFRLFTQHTFLSSQSNRNTITISNSKSNLLFMEIGRWRSSHCSKNGRSYQNITISHENFSVRFKFQIKFVHRFVFAFRFVTDQGDVYGIQKDVNTLYDETFFQLSLDELEKRFAKLPIEFLYPLLEGG